MISVIVPIYNAEKLLSRCIDSILGQSYSDLELLLINDGSTDASGEICDEYAMKHACIRVFHKQNGGVSSARNWGIENAKGDWLAFCDADDYVDVEYLASLLPAGNEDFVMDSSFTKSTTLPNRVWKDAPSIGELIMEKGGHISTPWGKLFNTSLINAMHLRFDERIKSGEDSLFVLAYLLNVKSIRTIDARLYHYDLSIENSLSKQTCSLKECIYFISQLLIIAERMKLSFSKVVVDDMFYRNSYRSFACIFGLLRRSPKSEVLYLLRSVFLCPEMVDSMDLIQNSGKVGKKYSLFYWLGRLHLYRCARYFIP